jgi:hypothetical protein
MTRKSILGWVIGVKKWKIIIALGIQLEKRILVESGLVWA